MSERSVADILRFTFASGTSASLRVWAPIWAENIHGDICKIRYFEQVAKKNSKSAEFERICPILNFFYTFFDFCRPRGLCAPSMVLVICPKVKPMLLKKFLTIFC